VGRQAAELARGVTWAPDGSGLYYTDEERGEENLYFPLAATGAPRRSGTHVLSGVSMARRRAGRGGARHAAQPGVLVTFPLKPRASMKTLVDVNATSSRAHARPTPRSSGSPRPTA
jgi:hypothetical protein